MDSLLALMKAWRATGPGKRGEAQQGTETTDQSPASADAPPFALKARPHSRADCAPSLARTTTFSSMVRTAECDDTTIEEDKKKSTMKLFLSWQTAILIWVPIPRPLAPEPLSRGMPASEDAPPPPPDVITGTFFCFYLFFTTIDTTELKPDPSAEGHLHRTKVTIGNNTQKPRESDHDTYFSVISAKIAAI